MSSGNVGGEEIQAMESRVFYNYASPEKFGRPFVSLTLEKKVPDALFLRTTQGRGWVASRDHECGQLFFANDQEIVDEFYGKSLGDAHSLEYQHLDGRYLLVVKNETNCAIAAKLRGTLYETRTSDGIHQESISQLANLRVYEEAIVPLQRGFELLRRFVLENDVRGLKRCDTGSKVGV